MVVVGVVLRATDLVDLVAQVVEFLNVGVGLLLLLLLLVHAHGVVAEDLQFANLLAPRYSIAPRPPSVAGPGERPQPHVLAEHILDVYQRSLILVLHVSRPFDLQVLNGGAIVDDQRDVEFSEHAEEDQQKHVEAVGGYDDAVEHTHEDAIHEAQLEDVEHVGQQAECDENEAAAGLEQVQHEELAVVVADAVVEPGAVVVHVQHAARAGAAVVGAFRLEDVALQTLAFAFLV